MNLDNQKPDIKISVRQTFGLDTDMEVNGFSKKNQYVPEIDDGYKFDRDTTLAILSGFAFNKRVLIQGYHGTGKSTHIEQVASRLNWPCVRVNLDSHISRIDLIGKDAIVLKDGKRLLRNFAVGDRWFIWPLEIMKDRIIKHKFKFGDYFCNDAKKRYAFEFVFSVFKHKSEFRNALEYYIDDNLKTNCQSHCQFCRTGVVTFSNRDKVFYFD